MGPTNLFSGLIQALYDHGHNGFILDLRLIPWEITGAVSHLRGTQENPLRAMCLAEPYQYIGFDLRHCDLQLSGTSATFGSNSTHSTFTYLGGKEDWYQAPLMGIAASQCTFTTLTDNLHPDSIHPQARDCSYFVEGRVYEKTRKYLVKKKFFRNGNTLHMRDVEGEWEEVRYGKGIPWR